MTNVTQPGPCGSNWVSWTGTIPAPLSVSRSRGSAKAMLDGWPVALMAFWTQRRPNPSCHTTNTSDPSRQGPTLFNIVGRDAGTAEGFRYSAGFATAKFKWDEGKLDAWLADPQAMIPGAIMPYKQAKPELRVAIVNYLKELH